MGTLARLFEVLTGAPHKYEQSQKVSDAADELSSDVQKLSETIRPYLDADDPLVAFMTDVFNQRQMRAGNAQGRKS